eukprot:GHVR01067015.1.p1 GENE.GHVR01067015.1~~GHVR01067015.1.p1  ORF type:complete len:210 (+),score=60.03 GHVR01067015.1:61-630(+)
MRSTYEIEEKPLPAMRVVGVKMLQSDPSKCQEFYSKVFGLVIKTVGFNNIRGPPLTIVHSQDDISTDGSVIITFTSGVMVSNDYQPININVDNMDLYTLDIPLLPRCLCTIHTGPYSGIHSAWNALSTAVEEGKMTPSTPDSSCNVECDNTTGVVTCGCPFGVEFYLNDPSTVTDHTQLNTSVCMCVKV